MIYPTREQLAATYQPNYVEAVMGIIEQKWAEALCLDRFRDMFLSLHTYNTTKHRAKHIIDQLDAGRITEAYQAYADLQNEQIFAQLLLQSGMPQN